MAHTKRRRTSREQADLISAVVVRIGAPAIHRTKSESLVIVDQNATVNTFPGLVHTARHTMGVGLQSTPQLNLREGAYHFVIHDWGEV